MKMPGKTTTEPTDVFTLLTEQILTQTCCFVPIVSRVCTKHHSDLFPRLTFLQLNGHSVINH